MPEEELSEPGIYHKSIQSGKWYLASVFCQKSLNLLTFFILARLLAPGDYGIMSVALLVGGLLDQLTNVSFGDALTQRKGDIEHFLDVFWTLDGLRALSIAVVLFIGGPWIAWFFNIPPAMVTLIQATGLCYVVSALANIRQIHFSRGLDFKKFFVRDLLSQLSFALASIGFAFFVQASAWALFAGYLVQDIVGVTISYVLLPIWPRLSFRFGVLRELVGFSKWVYAHEFLDLLIAQIDKILVGRYLQPVEFGLYAKAKDLSLTATNVMGSMMSKVALPAYSKVQDQMERIHVGFMKSVDLIVLSSFPFTLLLILEGGSIVSIFLGAKWMSLVVPLKIFAFGNLFLAFVRIVSPVLNALGRPKVNFQINVLQAVLTIPSVYFGFQYFGVNGLVWAVVVVWMCMFFYAIIQAHRVLRIPKQMFGPVILSGISAAVITTVVDSILRQTLPGDSLVSAALRIVAAAGSYGLVLYVLGQYQQRGPWVTFRSILHEVVGRR